jgi:hypothetical protein
MASSMAKLSRRGAPAHIIDAAANSSHHHSPLAVANDKNRDHCRQIDFCWDYFLKFFIHSPDSPFSIFQISPCRTPVPPLSISAHSFRWPIAVLGSRFPPPGPANFQKKGFGGRRRSDPTNSNFEPETNCSVLKSSVSRKPLILHMSFIVYFHS